MARTSFKVVIRFGGEETRREVYGRRQGDKFEFPTAAELDAYLLGVDTASGWMDYEIVKKDRPDEHPL